MRISLATVLAIGVTVLVSQPGLAATQSPAPVAAAAPSKPALNLNTATLEQLETLPGIGRKTAERILESRTKSGSFKRIGDLMKVEGLGEKSLLRLERLVAGAA